MWRLLNKWCDICTISFKKKLMNACAFECASISFYPKEGLKVALVPPQIDVPRQLHVESFYEKDNHFYVTFEEVKEKTQMQQFDHMHLLVEEEVAKTLEKPATPKFVGWSIQIASSQKKFLIKSVEEMPTQELAVCEDMNGSEFQIVLHKDLIESIDEDAKTVIVNTSAIYFDE